MKKKRIAAGKEVTRWRHEDLKAQKVAEADTAGDWLREHDPKYKKLEKLPDRLI